jgi:hypothetical protein
MLAVRRASLTAGIAADRHRYGDQTQPRGNKGVM